MQVLQITRRGLRRAGYPAAPLSHACRTEVDGPLLYILPGALSSYSDESERLEIMVPPCIIAAEGGVQVSPVCQIAVTRCPGCNPPTPPRGLLHPLTTAASCRRR